MGPVLTKYKRGKRNDSNEKNTVNSIIPVQQTEIAALSKSSTSKSSKSAMNYRYSFANFSEKSSLMIQTTKRKECGQYIEQALDIVNNFKNLKEINSKQINELEQLLENSLVVVNAGIMGKEQELRNNALETLDILTCSENVKDCNVGHWLKDMTDRKIHEKTEQNTIDKKKIIRARKSLYPVTCEVTKKCIPRNSLVMTSSMSNILVNVSTWENFDIFKWYNITKDKCLSKITMHLIEQLHFVNTLNINRIKLFNFLCDIEKAYHTSNPFHNAIHASDVVQAEFYWVLDPEVSKHMTEIDILSCLIAAACHDVGHPGSTEAFHIKSQSDYAITYNDASVLENFHLATTFKLLKKQNNNWQCDWDIELKREFRSHVISLIFATDINDHHSFLASCHQYIDNDKSFIPGSPNTDESKILRRKLLRDISLKASDLSNPCRPKHIMLEWCRRLISEFAQQGELEKKLGLEVSPMMDPAILDVCKMQIGFVDVVVAPLYYAWVQLAPSAQIPLNQMIDNKSFWLTKQKKEQMNKTNSLVSVTTDINNLSDLNNL